MNEISNWSIKFDKNNRKLILYCYRKKIIEFNLILDTIRQNMKKWNEKNYKNIVYEQNKEYNYLTEIN